MPQELQVICRVLRCWRLYSMYSMCYVVLHTGRCSSCVGGCAVAMVMCYVLHVHGRWAIYMLEVGGCILCVWDVGGYAPCACCLLECRLCWPEVLEVLRVMLCVPLCILEAVDSILWRNWRRWRCRNWCGWVLLCMLEAVESRFSLEVRKIHCVDSFCLQNTM